MTCWASFDSFWVSGIIAFRLLYRDRCDLTGRPLRDRRARLEDVVAESDLVSRYAASRRTA
jgi:ATP-dependent DNA ligase